VQTPSDTTFRVYDINRLKTASRARCTSKQALECIDFSGTPEPAQASARTSPFLHDPSHASVPRRTFKIEKSASPKASKSPSVR
jgi:hypothetical protein